MSASFKILVAVPTYNRHESLAKHWENWLPYNEDMFTLRYFVEPQQVDQYAEVIPKELIVPTANNIGLAGQKLHIKTYAEKNKYTWVLKLDDDIRRFSKRGKYTPERDKAIKSRIQQLMVKVPDGVGAISIPYRQELYPNIVDVPLTKRNMRLQSSYFIKPHLIDATYNYTEDFAQTLYVYKRGYYIPRTGLFAQDVSIPVGAGNGGLENPKRKALATQETMQLLLEYKGIGFKDDPDLGLTPDISRYINAKM